MTLVVPFDGSDLAKTALVRAAEFGSVFEKRVLAASVIPKRNAEYAREQGWIADGEDFDRDAIVSTLHREVTDLCPSADFHHEVVGRFAPPGTIASRLRRIARESDASMVFLGSENAGELVTSLSSVGSTVAAADAYDVVIVRHHRPSKIESLRAAGPDQHVKSNFYPSG